MNSGIDLTNCDTEPIHTPFSIQPHGYLLAFTESWEVAYWSENISSALGFELHSYDTYSASELFNSQAAHCIRNKVQKLRSYVNAENCKSIILFNDEKKYDVTIHSHKKIIFIEFEDTDLSHSAETIQQAVQLVERLEACANYEQIIVECTKHIFALTAFDRVMVYKFDEDGSGEVISEVAVPGIGTFKGLHFPSSDIPSQARILYEKNLLRHIADIGYNKVALIKADSYESVEELDMSYCILRSVSPIHVEYLKNMGVKASFSISILYQGKLWGLIACHHYSQKYLNLELRQALYIYGKFLSYLIEKSLNRIHDEQARKSIELRDRVLSFFSQNMDESEIDRFEETLRSLFEFDGMVIAANDQIIIKGETLPLELINEIIKKCKKEKVDTIFYTNNLSTFLHKEDAWKESICGFLAIPATHHFRYYIILLRKEAARKVTWAGNPEKAIEYGPNGPRLTPRKSFDKWVSEVKMQCKNWSEFEIELAKTIKGSLFEVLFQETVTSNDERAKLIVKQELLIAELNHRVRNLLGLMKGIVTQTSQNLRESSAIKSILGRISSLARAHDLITKQHWGAGSLKEIINQELEVYLNDSLSRIRISGKDCFFAPEALDTLSLVIHELTTNSVKYGALCSGEGHVEITIDDTDGDVTLIWQEINGPEVNGPTKRGFGSTIIERSIPHQLGGTSEVTYEKSGFKGVFLIPKQFLIDEKIDVGPAQVMQKSVIATNKTRQKPQATEPNNVIKSKNMLLVEDNLLIALDAQQIFEQLGANSVYVASNVEQALTYLDNEPIDIAMLDVNLGAENSFPVANRLQAMNLPYIFASGYDAKDIEGNSFSHVPIVRKPYSKEILLSTLDAYVNRFKA